MKFGTDLIHRCVLLAGTLALATSALADSDAQFTRANQEYGEGKFKEAIGDYETIVHSGAWTAALFYNLGNAYFRTRDFGRAILNYERALALEPNHPETPANLRVARDEARALELLPDWPQRFLRFTTSTQATVMAAILFWIGAFLLAAYLFSRRRRLIALALCLFVAAALLIYVMMASENGTKGRSLAVVLDGDVQARLATADTAAAVLALPPGTEIKVDQQRGDWVYADLPNNLRGWIPAKSVERVRL